MILWGPPAHLSSKLPPPGESCLSDSLQEWLSQGQVGSVYPLSLTEHHNVPQIKSCLPSPVVEIVDPKTLRGREAWFYEEMEDLQGVSIAWCYRFFNAEVPNGCEILSWADRDETLEEEVLNTESNNTAAPFPGVGRMSVSVLVLETRRPHFRGRFGGINWVRPLNLLPVPCWAHFFKTWCVWDIQRYQSTGNRTHGSPLEECCQGASDARESHMPVSWSPAWMAHH